MLNLSQNDMLWKQQIQKYYTEVEQFKDETTENWGFIIEE